MDPNSLMAAFASLDMARRAVGAAIDIRDFNKAATELAKLNDALLTAQNALLSQNATLFEMQREKFETAEELRKLREAMTERQSYSLFKLPTGCFVYRVNQPPQESGTAEPFGTEPMHYLCQHCFDKGVKAVLQPNGEFLNCPHCLGALRQRAAPRVEIPSGRSDYF